MATHHHQARAADHAELAPEPVLAHSLATATTPGYANNMGTQNKGASDANLAARAGNMRNNDGTDSTPPPHRSSTWWPLTPLATEGETVVIEAKERVEAALAEYHTALTASQNEAAATLSSDGINVLCAAMDQVKDSLSGRHLAEFTAAKIKALCKQFPAAPLKAT